MFREILDLIIDGFSVAFLILWTVLFLALVTQYFLNLLGGKYRIPFLPTPQKMVDMMIEVGDIKDGDRVIDLGSGIGSIVIRLAQKRKVHATGIEINLFLHIIASTWNFFVPKEGSVELKWGSMFNIDLREYDVVMIFLTTSFIDKFLREKLEKELRKGAKIVSYAFKIDTSKFKVEEFETGKKGLGKTIYVYTRR